MASGLYPGKGLLLTLASGATGSAAQEPVWTAPRTADPVIPATDYSLSMPVSAGLKVAFTIVFDDVPTTDASIEFAQDPTFADAIIIDTVPAVALQKLAVWTTEVLLPGFLRVSNTSDQDINEVWGQQIATTAV